MELRVIRVDRRQYPRFQAIHVQLGTKLWGTRMKQGAVVSQAHQLPEVREVVIVYRERDGGRATEIGQRSWDRGKQWTKSFRKMGQVGRNGAEIEIK